MIEKLPIIDQQKFDSQLGKQIVILLNAFSTKINEAIDSINTTQKEHEDEWFEIREWIDILEAVRKSVNIHEKQIDELQMKLEPHKCEPAENTIMAKNANVAENVTNSKMENVAENGKCAKNAQDPYAEQRKWVGKLCRFWDDDYKTIKHFGILASINEREFCKYEADNGNYFCACEPVKPDDDIIYKGE